MYIIYNEGTILLCLHGKCELGAPVVMRMWNGWMDEGRGREGGMERRKRRWAKITVEYSCPTTLL